MDHIALLLLSRNTESIRPLQLRILLLKRKASASKTTINDANHTYRTITSITWSLKEHQCNKGKEQDTLAINIS